MSTRLVVDDHNQLQETRINDLPEHPAMLKVIAKIVSYIFHPLFIPVYLSWFLIRIQPYLFAGFSDWDKMMVMIRFVVMYTFFPLITVLLAKGLGFLQSIYLKTQRDRIIPYVASGIYYFWMWWVLRNQPEFPDMVIKLTLAIFIASSIGLIVNIYMKVSMHGIAMGVMITFMMLLAFLPPVNFGIYISITLLIAGGVCTSRFIVSDHTQAEVYGGLVLGIFSQLVAYWLG
jgi:hypothetical protein